MNTIEVIVAIEEIKVLKARYCRAIDTKDTALFRELFTSDAVLDARGSATDPDSGFNTSPAATSEVLHGREEIVGRVMGAIQSKNSVHHAVMPEIEILGPDAARGTWAMRDHLRMSQGPVSELSGAGYYHDEYCRTGGRWQISRLTLTRLRVDVVPRER
jgi:hypothetical protein